MSIIINSNMYALNTAKELSSATRVLNNSFERLASGLRINQAKDDVAGFSISTRMEVAIREQNQGIQNVADAISMTQIADSGLQESANILHRMRELAIQSSNDTYEETDRQSMEDEFLQLNTQLDHLTTYTEYNGQNLLDGSMVGKKIEVGGTNGSSRTLEWLSVEGTETETAITFDDEVSGIWWVNVEEEELPSLLSQGEAEQALGHISTALTNLAAQRTRIGAFESRLHSIQDNLSRSSLEVSAARSKIRDVDMAQETATLTHSAIIQNATVAILAQANQQPALAMQLFS